MHCMNKEQLVNIIKNKKSFLCIGLDTDINKIPKHLLDGEDPIFEFNKQIVDATNDLCISYKPNVAFYESRGSKGWLSLEKTIKYIKQNHKDIFLIADAKRGDIGNTSKLYAKTFFDDRTIGFSFDAVTVAPYMGFDSVSPFFEFNDKWVILLIITSNDGAQDFQMLQTENKKMLFEEVLTKSKEWGNENNLMYVVGATKAEMLSRIRKFAPDNFLLVPGIGAQGGSLSEVAKYGINKECGLIVNSSRDVIYAGKGIDFADKARTQAQTLQKIMEAILNEYEII